MEDLRLTSLGGRRHFWKSITGSQFDLLRAQTDLIAARTVLSHASGMVVHQWTAPAQDSGTRLRVGAKIAVETCYELYSRLYTLQRYQGNKREEVLKQIQADFRAKAVFDLVPEKWWQKELETQAEGVKADISDKERQQRKKNHEEREAAVAAVIDHVFAVLGGRAFASGDTSKNQRAKDFAASFQASKGGYWFGNSK